MHIVYRRTCRVCGSASLTPVIDLGEQYLQGAFVKEDRRLPPSRKIPTALVRCDPVRDERACGLLQLSKTLPPEILYSSYWYRSGTNQTMTDHLAGIANELAGFVKQPRARVLDIGCNDGTLLQRYPTQFFRCGVDPSDIAATIPGDITVIHDLFPAPQLKAVVGGEPFDIITSIAMLYDLEDPVAFVREIKTILAAEGVWAFEMSYLPAMLETNAYDTICHEHLEYYSLAVLEYMLAQVGLKVFRVGLNEINGGSIRCYATHAECLRYDNPTDREFIAGVRQREFDLELDTDRPYKEFQERINIHRHELVTLIRRLRGEGKKIHIYGASTKGNTLLQFCGLDHSLIECAADRNPDKHGARTIGSDIPIVSEAESRALRPDYYLVLPWHFRTEFVRREQETLARGTRLIFPLPKIEIVGQ